MQKRQQSIAKIAEATLCVMEVKKQAKKGNCDEQKAERKAGFRSKCNALDFKGFLGNTSNIHPRALRSISVATGREIEKGRAGFEHP